MLGDQTKKQRVSERMRSVRSAGTAPELILRQRLPQLGLRTRASGKNLPGKPDLVFPKHRLAVFVDGDFWHGHQWIERKLSSLDQQFRSKKQVSYWVPKIRRNMARDCKATDALHAEG